jgi:hypothetical protein
MWSSLQDHLMIRRCGGNFQASLFHRTQLVTVQLRLGFRARHRHYRSTFAYVAIAVENNGVAEKDFKTYFYITKKGMDLHLSPMMPGIPLKPEWRLDPA